ncbi:MAG TPA: NnrS family protein, partial [Pseudobdellovibrionaceae bacterium]|nr:NnrS family protein [Pseudobdellovibrionaceae bacterium]
MSPKHSIWLAGFRPFFLLASIMGMLMPGLWGLTFSGKITMPAGINPMQWHAHEMLYGFGAAVLIGFLLTASKNWVNVRGIHGAALMGLAGLWTFERGLIFYSSGDSYLIKHLGLSLFLAASGIYIAWTLIKYNKGDTFKDNYFFLFLLAMIVLSKNLLLSEIYYQHGIAMSLG